MNSSEQTSWLPKEEGGYITHGKIASAQTLQTKKTYLPQSEMAWTAKYTAKTQKLRLVNNVGKENELIKQ